jgi:hypothetical protein
MNARHPQARADAGATAREPVLAPQQPASPLELRVLGGPQAGAAIAWPEPGRALILAVGDDGEVHGEPADLQLLGEAPVRLRLRALARGQARCEVLRGEVAMDGEPQGAGSRFEWPRQVPLQLGDSLAIAFGDTQTPIWALATAEELPGASSGLDDEGHDDAAEHDHGAADEPPARGRLDAWLAGSGAVLGVAGLVWSLLVTLPTAPQAAVHRAPAPIAMTAQQPQDVLPPPPAPSAPAPAVAAVKPAPEPAAPAAPMLPAAGNEPGKRIVTLVSQGALPHLVTADGGRYFVGATLPSGHRLAAVLPQGVVLERDGRETRIDF